MRKKSPAKRQAQVIGRQKELTAMTDILEAGKNLLIEGPVGVGKTTLAAALAQRLKQDMVRVDGDSRYTEQKLTGWFDPPMVIKKGYQRASFIEGPLSLAMRKGAILFINELNRMPEGVQNILLPALDERHIFLPHLGELKAHPNFKVIATQNPKDFVATTHLSEALLDRFEWFFLDYQSEEEELAILAPLSAKDEIKKLALRLVRSSREDSRIRRGASIRAAMSMVSLAEAAVKKGRSNRAAVEDAALICLPTRLDWDQEYPLQDLVADWLAERINAKKKDSVRT